MIDVLLVYPCDYKQLSGEKLDIYDTRELGLLYLASVLVNNGYNVELLPAVYNLKELESKIKKIVGENNLKLVATTGLTHEYPAAQWVLKKVKEIDKNVRTVIGGQHVTWLAEEVLTESPYIDVVAKGEGEIIILDLLKKDLKDVKGIVYRENGVIKENSTNEFCKEIILLNEGVLKSYLRKINEKFDGIKFNLSSSRGCPYNCLYCSEVKFWGNFVRNKPVKDTIDELDIFCNSKNRNKIICFWDSTFTVDPKYTKELCSAVKTKNYDFGFWCYTRVDTYNKEIASVLRGAGFNSLAFGVEHFHPEVLKTMGKNITEEQIRKALENAKELNQLTRVYFITGHPGDNTERAVYSYQRAKKFMNLGLIDMVQPFIFVPYPATDVFKNPSKYNAEILSYDWIKYMRDIYPVIEYKDFSADEIYYLFMLFEKLKLKNKEEFYGVDA